MSVIPMTPTTCCTPWLEFFSSDTSRPLRVHCFDVVTAMEMTDTAVVLLLNGGHEIEVKGTLEMVTEYVRKRCEDMREHDDDAAEARIHDKLRKLTGTMQEMLPEIMRIVQAQHEPEPDLS